MSTPERFHDLLADQALEGLSPEEARELEAFLAEDSGAESLGEDRDSYELAAAASVLAFVLAAGAAPEPMPAHVEREVLERARAFVLAQTANPEPAAAPPDAAARVLPMGRTDRARTAPAPAVAPRSGLSSGRRAAGWGWLAAAACLALAVAGWWPRIAAGPDPGPAPVIVEQAERPVPPSPEEKLAQAGDRVATPWQATEDPDAAGAQGEVVWSGQLQQGYMRFRGLAANDPTKSQYQLWIFDANQDERYPIDGGVFDVPAGQTEVVVPIDPKLRVAKPTLFAVTVEKPGGVVVSSRERIVLIAPQA